MSGKILGILGLLVALCLFMTFATSSPWYDISTSNFLKTGNLQNLLSRTALYGILGVGVAFVIITSGIDLSIGSMVCFSGVLLAIFLHVEYIPLNSADVRSISSESGQIELLSTIGGLAPGDRIRYSGGTRAPTTVFTVGSVSTETGTTRVTVREAIRQDDSAGEVSLMLSIQAVERFTNDDAEFGGRIVIDGTLPLQVRDQIKLVHPKSGLRTEEIVRVESAADSTTVFIRNDPGQRLTNEWLAIPLKRHQRMSVPIALLAVVVIAKPGFRIPKPKRAFHSPTFTHSRVASHSAESARPCRFRATAHTTRGCDKRGSWPSSCSR